MREWSERVGSGGLFGGAAPGRRAVRTGEWGGRIDTRGACPACGAEGREVCA